MNTHDQRQKFQPYLTEEQLPAFKAVKSVFNITRERGWRTLWEKELGNIAHEYKIGMATSGFVENDDIHVYVESAVIFLTSNDLKVPFHIGFGDELFNYVWIKSCANITTTKSENRKAYFYPVVQGARTCMKVLTSLELKATS